MDTSELKRLERAVRALRLSGVGQGIAESKVAGVIKSLSYQLTDGFSYAEAEAALAREIAQWPSILVEDETLSEALAAKKAERAANPTRDDLAALPAHLRLAAANKKERETREAAAAASGKLNSPDHPLSRLQEMTRTQRLELANDMKRFQAPEPKAPSLEDIKKCDAMRRLSFANEEALRKAFKGKAE